MKKFLFFSFIFLTYLTGCCNGSYLQTPNPETKHPEVIGHLMSSTSELLMSDSENKNYRMFCSAVWISPTKFISARHCGEALLENDLTDLFNIPVDIKKLPGTLVPYSNYSEVDKTYQVAVGDKPHFAIITGYSEDADLVIMESIDEGDHEFVKVADQDPLVGDRVHIVGHTSGLVYNYLEGVVSYQHRDMAAFWELTPSEEEREVPMRDVIQITSLINHGNSGGGAYDQDGNLVGICSFMMGRTTGATFFVPQNKINEFLKQEFVSY